MSREQMALGFLAMTADWTNMVCPENPRPSVSEGSSSLMSNENANPGNTNRVIWRVVCAPEEVGVTVAS